MSLCIIHHRGTEDKNLILTIIPKLLCISTVSLISDFAQVFDNNTKISLCLCGELFCPVMFSMLSSSIRVDRQRGARSKRQI